VKGPESQMPHPEFRKSRYICPTASILALFLGPTHSHTKHSIFILRADPSIASADN
jgi:hypothetical protein